LVSSSWVPDAATRHNAELQLKQAEEADFVSAERKANIIIGANTL
jgi:hypothetical protein